MRKFAPLKTDHPMVVDQNICGVCETIFKEGDEVTLIATIPASPEEAKKAQAGKPYTSAAAVVHWDCRGADV